jgi:hypothetical protein
MISVRKPVMKILGKIDMIKNLEASNGYAKHP